MNAPRTPVLVTRDVYDVAQLAGGLSRVVDTAVVALLERGRLTVDGAGRLQAVGTAVHPVEAAVLDLAGPRPRRSITSLHGRAQEEPRLTAVADRLVAAGLLRRNPVAGLSSSWPAHLRTAAGRAVLAEWRAAPPVPNGAVALDGPSAMADPVLRDTVFRRRSPPGDRTVPHDRRRGRRRLELGVRGLVASAPGAVATAAAGGWRRRRRVRWRGRRRRRRRLLTRRRPDATAPPARGPEGAVAAGILPSVGRVDRLVVVHRGRRAGPAPSRRRRAGGRSR